MTIASLDQGFGIEIECYLPQGAARSGVCEAINQRVPAALCGFEGYNHIRRPNWKIVTDGSLGDDTRGIEVVSPVLRGAAGLIQVREVMRALQDFGCTVGKACGLHVHIGVGTTPVPPMPLIKNLVKLYAMFEPVIDSIMPPSRRASANTYCRSLTALNAATLERATDIDGVVRAIGGAHGMSRFCKLNVMSYGRHRTVEFRQHSGTLDADKATMWIALCGRMVDKAARGFAVVDVPVDVPAEAVAPTPAAPLVNRARVGSKSWIIGNMMMRPEGVTAAEAMEAVNWPSVSLPQQAAICGIEFTTHRTGRVIRYFARNAAAEAMVAPQPARRTERRQETFAITVDGFCDAIGALQAERDYLSTRRANLGGPVQWAA